MVTTNDKSNINNSINTGSTTIQQQQQQQLINSNNRQRYHNNNNNRKRPPYHHHNNHSNKRHNNNNYNQRQQQQQRKKKQQQKTKQQECCSVCHDINKIAKYKCPKCRVALYCSVDCCKQHKETCSQVVSKATTTTTTTAGANTATTEAEASPYEKILLSFQPLLSKSRYDEDDDEEDDPNYNLSKNMKNQLRNSKWLHGQLEDGGLRDLIQKIVELKNPDNISEVTKHYPQFAMFVDKLLVLAGILQRSSKGGGDGEDGQKGNRSSIGHNSGSINDNNNIINTISNESEIPIEDWLQHYTTTDFDSTSSWQQRLTLKPIFRKKTPTNFEPVSQNNDSDDDDDSSNEEDNDDDSSSSSDEEESSSNSSCSDDEE